VNDIGAIHRLEGGIVKVTFIEKFEDPHFNPIEQISLIWPESSWIEAEAMTRFAIQELAHGTFSRHDARRLLTN
jgi:hypothetical protein